MSALANALRRAKGLPEDNTVRNFEKPKPIETKDASGKRHITAFQMDAKAVANERGLMDFGYWDNGSGMPKFFPICSNCRKPRLFSNKGAGTLCEKC